LLIALAAGCPRGEPLDLAESEVPQAQPGADGNEAVLEGTEGQQAPIEYPPVALDYVLSSLRSPATAQYPPLAQIWLAVAQFTHLPYSPAADELRDEVGTMVATAGDSVLPELAAAWLAVDPQAAEEYIAGRLAAGQIDYVNSLMYAPQSARRVLAKADVAQLDPQMQMRIVRLLVQLRPLTPEDEPLLAELAAGGSEDVKLQVAGLQLALNPEAEERRQLLWKAIRDEQGALSGAAEGIKFSGDARFADALVPLAAEAMIGDEDPEVDKQRRVVFAAYALTYLPGEQAQLMRRKLLGAADPTVRWAARLGELLHGDPSYWNTAVEKHGVDDPELWIALEPSDVADPELLSTLESAARSTQPDTRVRAARQLNRYSADASNPAVGETLALLIGDQVTEVSAAGWYAAGRLASDGLADQARAVMEDRGRAPDVRLAAAYYLMRVAEAQAEEVTQ